MRIAKVVALVVVVAPLWSVAPSAQQAQPTSAAQQAQQAQQGRGRGRGQMTPEQREAAAKLAHEAEAAKPRPIDALDSVWIEELTYMEVRDAMKAGKTTALVLTGSTEQNGPYLPGGKHFYALKLVGESMARKLGNALIAPIIPLEEGNPSNRYLEWGSLYLTGETYRAVLRDVATSLKSQGFRNIVLLGDSGGNTRGLADIAKELSSAWTDGTKIVHVPAFYNWTSKGGVRDFVQSNGIPEKIGADGIHDEYGLTAVMMAYDPKMVRHDQRVKAGKTTINGISIVPKEQTIEMGKKIVEFRATVGAEAIRKALGGGQD